MDENFGKEMDEKKKPTEEQQLVTGVFAVVLAACVASVIACLFIRLDRWILH